MEVSEGVYQTFVRKLTDLTDRPGKAANAYKCLHLAKNFPPLWRILIVSQVLGTKLNGLNVTLNGPNMTFGGPNVVAGGTSRVGTASGAGDG
jgi:hypothetical protein